MGKFIDLYDSAMNHVEFIKSSIMTSVVTAIKTINVNPVELGNGKYFYVEEDGVEVPAYWDEISNDWKPIYDKNNTGEFGWSDFKACLRIFEAIQYKLFYGK